MKISTLAGENKGATTKSEHSAAPDTSGVMYTDEKTMSAIMNSNYQAVNNLIMLKGMCAAEEPGVRVIISDHESDDNVKDVKAKGREKGEQSLKEGRRE